MHNVPQVDLRAQYAEIRDEIDEAVHRVLESQQFILGPEVEALEQEMVQYTGAGYAVGVACGSDALLLSLQALQIGEGDAVITVPFTFFATAGSVRRSGALPIFVDIDPQSFTISPGALEAFLRTTEASGAFPVHPATGRRIKAVLPVHLFGQPADLGSIRSVIEPFHLHLIEDSAQALGARGEGPRGSEWQAGTVGICGALSFFPSKNLGGAGDGGMVLTSDPGLADKVRSLRVHGTDDWLMHRWLGMNSRLDELQSAILRVKLRHLDRWCDARAERARSYDELFDEYLPEVRRPQAAPWTVRHTYNQYVIRVPGRRDALRDCLADQGIRTSVYYPLPLHLQPCFQELGYQPGDFPEAERAGGEVVALPMYPELKEEDQRLVVDAIAAFYESS